MEIDMKDIYKEAIKEIGQEGQLPTMKRQEEIIVETPPRTEAEELIIDEEELIEEYGDRWSYAIKQRGEDYYYSNNVLSVSKNKNKYIAKVGGNAEKPYSVTFEFTPEGLNYSCTCPCSYPCKHEYAVLMAISNGDYEDIELKMPIKEKEINLISMIKEIPAEEIKKYLLSPIGKEKVVFEATSFNNYFRKYMPTQKYEFYYNNLYNALVLDDDYIELIESYFNRARQYLSGNEFSEVFKIIKSVVEAYNDSNKLNFDDYAFDMISKISMLLRITFRKADGHIKSQIEEWAGKITSENYYNNYYLEDLFLSLR